jgi:class 3 adenylate cyclase
VTSEAERRQLTVMFCDLVGSTQLSEQLDPEDLREVVLAYQETCGKVINRFEGHIAQHLGDGLLVYFGYPQAHEDDAQRAVRSGLGIVEAITRLNPNFQERWGVELALRVGIHTGLVVTGEVGDGTTRERLAMGKTPNIAARLQEEADLNSVLVSTATYRLIEGFFACRHLDALVVKGLSQPLDAYQVRQESAARSRLDAVAPEDLTTLVGREQEIGLLFER